MSVEPSTARRNPAGTGANGVTYRAPSWWDIHQDRVVGFLLFMPLVSLIVGLTVYPIFTVLRASLFQQSLYSQVTTFVGLRNFVTVAQSEAFLRSVGNTLVFTFGGLAIQMVVGLLIALLVHSKFPLRAPVRGAMLFSYLVPYVVAALTWRFMMSDATGILNYLIRTSGLGIPASWFGSTDYAMLGVILVNSWKNFPFMVLVFLAQLQSIDPQLYEAGAVDGTTRWTAFRHITFPALLPIILVVGMLRTIWNFNNFEVVFLLTQGGPLGKTETLPLLIYRFIFGEFSLGRGAALAVFVFLILVAMSLVYWRMYERAQGKFE